MTPLPTDLDGMKRFLATAPASVVERLQGVVKPLLQRCWLYQPGPQTDAYFSPADELLYGGAAGGGKTDLLLGLATTAHRRSLIFRAQAKDLDGLWDRLLEIVPDPAVNNVQKRSFKTRDGVLVEGGHLDAPGSERAWQGRPHDFIGFDEAAQLQEQRVMFVMQWLRSTDPGQRKRVVFATNPPIPEIKDGKLVASATGDWLFTWFAPWLDPMFPRPAKDGELRWCYMRSEGERIVTVWVDGPGYYASGTTDRLTDPSTTDIAKGLVVAARSRTFIRSLLSDNAFLSGTGYIEKLSGIPEPMRSMLLNGDFTIRLADDAMQVIPTAWVIAAEERWKAKTWQEVRRYRQLVLAGDIAQGGVDDTVLQALYENNYFEHPLVAPGQSTPTGIEVMAMVLAERSDGSVIVLDGTGGWGGSTRDLLETHHQIECEMHIASEVDGSFTPDNMLKYANLRAKMWWEFRIALDPRSGMDICLPPRPRLRAQLTAPRFGLSGKTLQVESKDEVRKRLGSSTDEADAVLMAWQYRTQALLKLLRDPSGSVIERLNSRRMAAQAAREAATDAFDYDPRAGF